MQHGYGYGHGFHLRMKLNLDYFPGRLKYAEIGKSMRLKFWFDGQTLLRVYYNTSYFYSAKMYLQTCIRVYDLTENISLYFKICPQKRSLVFSYL